MTGQPLISTCIAIKNRSRMPYDGGFLEIFPECVKSLRNSALDAGIHVELIVADFMSDDWPLGEWLPKLFLPFNSTLITVNSPFSLGRGKNMAAACSTANVLLFCDTDMIVPPHVLTQGLAVARAGRAYFPEYQRFTDTTRTSTVWGNGHGVCVVQKSNWVDHNWVECSGWGGGEDDLFAHPFIVQGKEAREKVQGFYHMWHPLDPSKTAADEKEKP